jgi:putative oxidoreductase
LISRSQRDLSSRSGIIVTTDGIASMKLDEIRAAWAPQLLSILRIIAGLVILQFGLTKLFGFPYYQALSNQPVLSLYWCAGLIELIGGALLLLGLFTPCAAFVLSGEMAFAYFIEHAPVSFFPLQNEGSLAVLFCFVFLYLAAAGGGPWSIDALRRNR